MRRRPPRSTRTDTLFPYTTRFLSQVQDAQPVLVERDAGQADVLIDDVEPAAYAQAPRLRQHERVGAEQADDLGARLDRQAGEIGARPGIGIAGAEAQPFAADADLVRSLPDLRSDTRRVGKEGVIRCRTRGWP